MSGTTTSKSSILEALRRNRPAAAELPSLEYAWTTYADPLAKFIKELEFVGGRAIVARDVRELNEQIALLPQCEGAKKVASLVPGVGAANVDLSAIDSPHALADIDVAILPGQFGVAENAAVWVTDEHVPLRALYFLCQHLILVVPAGEIVDHMHAAYERLVGPPSRGGPALPPNLATAANLNPGVPLGSRHLRAFAEPAFGAFISGPSKTADIEQSLVIGAHGPRSLVVCFLEK